MIRLTIKDGDNQWEVISDNDNLNKAIAEVSSATAISFPGMGQAASKVRIPKSKEETSVKTSDESSEKEKSDNSGKEDTVNTIEPKTLMKEIIMKIGKSDSGIKSRACKDDLGVSKDAIKEAFIGLLEKGLIEKQGVGAGTVYTLTAKGNKLYKSIAEKEPEPVKEPEKSNDDDLDFDDDSSSDKSTNDSDNDLDGLDSFDDNEKGNDESKSSSDDDDDDDDDLDDFLDD